MSKQNDTPVVSDVVADEIPVTEQPTQTADATPVNEPAFITTLLQHGHVTLEAPTREAMAEMVNDIPAECRYSVGAIGRSLERGTFTLRVDKI